jgi:hypothetical protein
MDRVLDPTASVDAFANLLAPVRQMQQDRLKMADRFAHYQYAVAGSYLDWALSLGKAATATATQFFAQQTEIGSKLGEQLRSRGEEFTAMAKDAQTTMSTSVKVAAASLSAPGKKVA